MSIFYLFKNYLELGPVTYYGIVPNEKILGLYVHDKMSMVYSKPPQPGPALNGPFYWGHPLLDWRW